ncbi:MAG: endo-1,4-beta-xylanase [Clostridia bacterium]|nr:endo-1,4-beta-xylanase [Clostridia bacterium]
MPESRRDVLRYFEEQKEFVKSRVAAGIELYRKGTARIQVVDGEGKPVANARIHAKQVRQAFKFGVNLFMIDEMETPEKNEIYKKKLPELFNLGTVPFYWRDLEPVEGKPRFAADSPKIYRRPATDLCVDYCLENGIEPKLHCLNYDPFTPDWLAGAPTRVVREKLSRRFSEIARRYASKIPMIEVTNETFCASSRTDFFREDNFVEWSFREAAKYFPGNELIINEAGIEWDAPNAHTNRNPYYQQVEKLLTDNVPVQGVGFQFHSFTPREQEVARYAHPRGRYAPEYLCAVMDKFEQLNLPLQITEMTIPAYSGDEEDEEIQAEILRNVYSLFFAQRSMEAVIYWNLPDGYAYRAEPGDMSSGENYFYGGLLRFDMSEKPAFRTLKRLIRDEWMTDVELTTDEGGFTALHGFYGDYELTVRTPERESVFAFQLRRNELSDGCRAISCI